MIQLAVLALALALAFGSGWKVRAWKADSDDAERIEQASKDAVRRADKADGAAEGHEKYREATLARARVVIREVERVVQGPVYSGACFDDAGLRILAADVAARSLAGEPAPAVPSASSPGAR